MRIWRILLFLLLTLLSGAAWTFSPQPAASQPTASQPPTTVIIPAAPATTPTPVHIITPTPKPVSPTDYLLPDSNSRYLTEADLNGLSHEQLCFARNEIYARHGRQFKTPQIAAYFNSKSWYHGTISPADFNPDVFNQYEKANISLIQQYEKKYFGGSYY